MRADCIAAEKLSVLRLRILAGQCGSAAVGSSALGEEIAEALLAGRCGADLTVSYRDTESEEQAECNAAENARRSLVERPAKGRYRARKTTQRQAQVPRSPLFCSATKAHART